MPVSEKTILELTNIADNDWHWIYQRGTGKFVGSVQVVLSDGSGAGDQLEMAVQASDRQVGDPNVLVDADFSSVNEEILGLDAGLVNTAGAVSAMNFLDSYMVAFWWRFGVRRTGGVTDNGAAKVLVHWEEL